MLKDLKKEIIKYLKKRDDKRFFKRKRDGKRFKQITPLSSKNILLRRVEFGIWLKHHKKNQNFTRRSHRLWLKLLTTVATLQLVMNHVICRTPAP